MSRSNEIKQTKWAKTAEKLKELEERVRWKGAIRLKPNREEIKSAIQLAKEIESKPKNYTANTSNYGRQRIVL